MPESVTDRPTKAHEYLFLLTKSARYYYDAEAIKEPFAECSLARLRQDGVGKWQTGGKKQRDTNYPHADAGGNANRHWKIYAGLHEKDKDGTLGNRNRRSVWQIVTQPYREAHFATFPEKLVEPCVLAGSRTGDLVLDPFAGSGTTLKVAQRLGRRGVGIDLNPDYLRLAQQRVRDQIGLAL